MKVVIVGGVAGGMSAAARLRRNDESARIVVFERGPFVSFANCGLPYFIGDVIEERENLLLQTPQSFKARFNVDVRVEHEVIGIDRKNRMVRVKNLRSGTEFDESYDKLVLSPGADPIRPKLPGSDSARIFVLRNIPDTDKIKGFVNSNKPKNAVVVGAGFIGLEMAENLHQLGLKVTVVEAAPQVLGVLDFEMAAFVQHELQAHDVTVLRNESAASFQDTDKNITVKLASGKEISTDMVIMAIGVRPESSLAKTAGLAVGERGGITVNEFLQTSDPDVYAAGDAIEVRHLISNRVGPIPLAGPSNKQGRIIADNIAFGNRRVFKGAIGTAIAKVFDVAAGCTGLSERLLKAEKIPFLASTVHAGSHAGYYPGASTLSVKILYAPDSGRLLGAQVVGREGVDKRLDVLALAVQKGLTIFDLEEFEHTYAPPYSSAKDPVNLVAFVASNVLGGRLKLVAWHELESLQQQGAFVLDVRTKGEFAAGHISGAVNIPVDGIRERLGDIPRDKPIVVYCGVGLRAYVACRILSQNGYSDVADLSGGYRTYDAVSRV